MRLVRSAMAVMHLRLQPEPARISDPCRTAEARPATEHNTTFTCTAAARATLRHARCGAVAPQASSSARTATTGSPSASSATVTTIGRQQTWQSSMYCWSPAEPSTNSSIGSPQYGHRVRSEEHTSELQSLLRISYAVFCLKK